MATPLPVERLKDFIRSIPPFHLLPQTALEELVHGFVIEYFKKGETILSPDGSPTQYLYIIRSGGVKILTSPPNARSVHKVLDYRDVGEFFGLVSLLSGEPSPFTVIAEENTICYLVKKEPFKKLMDDHPGFFLYFTSGPSKGFKQFDAKAPQSTSGLSVEPVVDHMLFTGRVKDIMQHGVLTCPAEETIVGVARKMTGLSVGSIIVVDESGLPIGIVTDSDLRSKILASGKLANVPVIDVMSHPVKTIAPDAFCFEAVLSMTTDRIKYLAVMDGLNLVGIVSERDLMVSQGNNPLAVIKGIQQAGDMDQIVKERKNIDLSLRIILEHGGMARDICELITSLNDHLTRKIIELAEESMVRERFGRPPVPYAWIALGSEGRCEQTLRTDQDNALVFADIARPEEEGEAQKYFLILAEKVVSGLEQCGFPRCRGSLMAVNPKWCQPNRVWLDYFRQWILNTDPTSEQILETFIFFDFRPIYGSRDLTPLWVECITGLLNTRTLFLHQMAETAVLHEPPLGFFKHLVVEKSGENKNRLNVKLNGLAPLVDAVRILALDQLIFETNTLERIGLLAESGLLTKVEAENLQDAFNVLMLLRIRHHRRLLSQGLEADNYINPDELTIIQRTMLKEAFKTIDKLQDTLKLRYHVKD